MSETPPPQPEEVPESGSFSSKRDEKDAGKDEKLKVFSEKLGKKNENSASSDGKVGWIGRLAERSTGLPEDETLATKDESEDRSLWSLAGLGLQFGMTVAMFAFMGYELDQWKGWSPWGVVSLSLIAVVGNLYLLIKQGVMEERKKS